MGYVIAATSAGTAGGDLTLGRIVLPTVNDSVTETLGGQLTMIGDQAAANARQPRSLSIEIPVQGFDNAQGFVAQGNRLRRQIRSLLQNDQVRLAGIYLTFAADPDLNGWLLIGSGDLAYDDGGVSYGSYKLTLSQTAMIATRRTHRPGYRGVVKDLRISTTPIDADGSLTGLATGFAALPILPIVPLPVGAYAPTVRGQSIVPTGARATSDGSVPLLTTLANGDVVVYERAESDMNKSDVIVLNTAAGGAVEEVYGGDYPLTDGTVPTIQNGACRVSYDTTGNPGFLIDAWNPATSGYVNQGKMVITRLGDLAGPDTALIGTNVREWSTDRVQIEAQVRNPADAWSYERVVVTLQRGWTGPRFEVYASPVSTGALPFTQLRYTAAAADPNATAVKIDSGGAQTLSTAGTGSTLFVSGPVGASTFTGENHVSLLRDGATHQATFAVLQPGVTASALGNSVDYGGSARNAVQFAISGTYLSVHLGFTAQTSSMVAEAEAIRYVSSPTATQVADAAASGGQCVKDTQATAANATLSTATALRQTKYRVLLRVKTDSGTTGQIYATIGGVATSTVTTTASAFTWIDLGDLVAPADSPTLQVFAVRTGGTGGVYVDRDQLLLVEDRTASGAGYAGARDIGQQALVDTRVQPRLVTR